jgi:membrane-associated phospholipid phosphatase
MIANSATFSPPYGKWLKRFLIVGTYITAVVVSFSRVWLEEHSVAQVLVGGTVGTIFGYCWHLLLQHIIRPLYPTIERHWIARNIHRLPPYRTTRSDCDAAYHCHESIGYFYFKDSSIHANVLAFEYENHCQARDKLLNAKLQ